MSGAGPRGLVARLVARLGYSLGWALFLLSAPLAGAWLWDLGNHDQLMWSFRLIAQEAIQNASSLTIGVILLPMALVAAVAMLLVIPATWILRGFLVERYFNLHPEVLEPKRRANHWAWVSRARRVEEECGRINALLVVEQRRRKIGEAALTMFAIDLHKADEKYEQARELVSSRLRRTILQMASEPERVTATIEDEAGTYAGIAQ